MALEVRDARLHVVVQQDVGRLQVPVDDRRVVQVLKPGRHAGHGSRLPFFMYS
jgi:hypothetical protein